MRPAMIVGKVENTSMGADQNPDDKKSLVRLVRITHSGSSLGAANQMDFYNLKGHKTHTIDTYVNDKGYFALCFQVADYQIARMLQTTTQFHIHAYAQWMNRRIGTAHAAGRFTCSLSLSDISGGPPTLTGVSQDIWLAVRNVKLPSRLLTMLKPVLSTAIQVYTGGVRPMWLRS